MHSKVFSEQAVLKCQLRLRTVIRAFPSIFDHNIYTMTFPVHIDGSLGEGGGQVLRIALCLSALYKIPVKIDKIRAGRPKPGLAAQHLKGVELLKSMCNAKVHGAYIGSTCITFIPNHLNSNKKHTFVADTGTAGCICLLAQIALPCALFFPQGDVVTLILKGGTNVPMGPQIEYFTEVLRPLLKKFGADFNFRLVRRKYSVFNDQSRGYYPKGGGEMHLHVKPVHALNAIDLINPGVPNEIVGWSHVSGIVNIQKAQEMADDVKNVLLEGFNKHNVPVPSINITCYKDTSLAFGNGSSINIVCTSTSGCVYGGSGLGSNRQEQITPGIQAANEILNTILTGSCVDEHLQDQLIILMALAKGTSKISLGSQKLTSHTKTAIQVAEMILKDYNLHFVLNEKKVGDNISYFLECEGCNYKPLTTW